MAKILIVEDEKALSKVLVDKLKNEDHDVLQAGNGRDGLAVALAEKPDIILLDIVMPIMDGVTMLKGLRKDPWGENARVIMLTNLSDNDQISECLERGVHDYLIKSNWSLQDILNKIKETI